MMHVSARELGSRLRELVPSNPKQRPVDDALWFDYYAGYADEFVAGVLMAIEDAVGTVLDPWNGAGTTTAVAARSGLSAVGLDVNPAAAVIAKARLLRSDVADSLQPLADDILGHARARRDVPSETDLLPRWLAPASAARIRRLERSVAQLLVPDAERTTFDAERLSSLAALFYLALFRTVRELLQPFFASNPTWMRLRVEPADRVEIGFAALADRFRHNVAFLRAAVARNAYPARVALPQIKVASSSAIPLDSGSVDAVVTSPPYCTRIDYAVATLPELAALGFAWPDVTQLRTQLIGTPTMLRDSAGERGDDSVQLRRLLRRVERHGSYAARSYYLPFYRQYFDGMRRSMKELYRVARPGAPLVLVVQDSWFKDIPVKTPAIVNEMAESIGWSLVGEHHFDVKTRAAMHPHRARRRTSRATETVTLLVR
ncbi:MAG: hypothetical protein WBC33_00255 [Conexibacter sp.]